LGIDPLCIWHHDLSTEKLHEVIAASSCVVIPSYSEGFCFAAVETIALKVPLISSGRGALTEVVSGKYLQLTALTLPLLTEALSKAIEGKWEESPVMRFEISQTLSQYMALYS